jgi:SAM-dependent methyltransferase
MTAYDQVNYEGRVFSDTHPQRLQAVAKLFGLQAPALDTCSVLELGCGDGANLIPMAAHLLHARFVGVDLANMPIERGKQRIQRLGLENIHLLHADVSKLGESLGKFDYIIAHGLYSWVPSVVRDGILELVRCSLTDSGVAFISYNALPGCRLRHLVREMLQFRFGARAFEFDTIPEARAFLGAFAGLSVDKKDHTIGEDAPKVPYLETLKSEIQFVLSLPDHVLFHDDMSAFAAPFYLHEFAAAAQAFGLEYLGEPGIDTMFPKAGSESFNTSSAGWIPPLADEWVAKQQYLDFALGRRFKQSLLCKMPDGDARHSRPFKLDRKVGAHKMLSMHLRTPLEAQARLNQDALLNRDLVKFEFFGRVVSLDEPIAKIAIHHLAEAFPDTVQAQTLIDLSLATCIKSGLQYQRDSSVQAMARLLWSLVLAGQVEILGQAIQVSARVPQSQEPGTDPRRSLESFCPQLSPVVADAITESLSLAGALHSEIRLEDERSRALALRMDGTRTVRQLAEVNGLTSDLATLMQFVKFLDRHGALKQKA